MLTKNWGLLPVLVVFRQLLFFALGDDLRLYARFILCTDMSETLPRNLVWKLLHFACCIWSCCGFVDLLDVFIGLFVFTLRFWKRMIYNEIIVY